jgi:hypothetical protein
LVARLQLRRLWEAGFQLNGTESKLSSPFMTGRYPDGAWELTLKEKVPAVWRHAAAERRQVVVSKTVEDASGHVLVTWRRAPPPHEREREPRRSRTYFSSWSETPRSPDLGRRYPATFAQIATALTCWGEAVVFLANTS